MGENDIDIKKLEEMRNNLKSKMKEREEDRYLGVKTRRSSDGKVILHELNKNKSKNNGKKNGVKNNTTNSKKSKTSGKNSNKSNKKGNTGSSKGNTSSSNRKKNGKKGKNSKKTAKKVSISLVILTICIFVSYSVFGREYIEDLQREEFIEMIEPMAVDLYKEYGIYPSVTISRAAIESNWGKSKLSKDAFNLFGIKADKSWDGRKISMNTKERYDDTEKAQFRRYRSYKESVYDYGKFLNGNKRYSKAGLFKVKNGKEQAQVLENAGYATKENSKGEPVYADVLIGVMERYKLDEIDARYMPKSK